MIAKILKLFAGSHYKRFYKKTRPIVAKINKIEEQYQSLTDEQLRAKTDEFKARYAKGESLDSLLPEAFAAVKDDVARFARAEGLEAHARSALSRFEEENA